MDTICKLCGHPFDQNNLEESIETHVLERHFLSYQDYYEIGLLDKPSTPCWKCGGPRYTMSPYLGSLYLPCPCCVPSPNSKQKNLEIREDIIKKISDYEGKVIKSKYYQYLVSLGPQDRGRLLPREYDELVLVLQDLRQRTGTKLDKTSIFKVTNTLGRPSEISARNIEALDLEVSDMKVTLQENGTYEMGEGSGIFLAAPRVVSYDPKHHARGSILNPGASRLSRRLKFSNTPECIKFWNTQNSSAKSIYTLLNKSGLKISYQNLPDETKWRIRFGILKTRPLITKVFDIYNEILKYARGVRDSVFLLNSFDFPNSQNGMKLSFTWSWEDQSWDTKESEIIKLSIL